jgi:hypothetical protein
MKNIHVLQENIYITSNEEIKDGDWFLTDDKRVEKCAPDWRAREWHKKIIITTDQDLIKDGVQKIDDEFLRWFVKNPSCEEVGVETFEVEDYVGFAGHTGYPTFHNEYKIIIPKEEPKQSVQEYEQQGLEKYSYELKQETLEEATKIAVKLSEHLDAKEQAFFIAGFQECAKWQQERSYSEEDMMDYSNYRLLIKKSLSPKEWFEQFKKK